LQALDTYDRLWLSIEVDLLCGLSESNGYDTSMVVVDRFSKMIRIIPFKINSDSINSTKAFIK